jgi:hypothetical protein
MEMSNHVPTCISNLQQLNSRRLEYVILILIDFKIERQMYNKLEQYFAEFYIDNVSRTWPANYRHRNSPSISAIESQIISDCTTVPLQMTGRIFLVIFFFWALLAIVTPTLVLLSESSKPYLDLNGKDFLTFLC